VKLGVMFQDRVNLGVRQLKDWIAAGVIGKPLMVDARVKWYRPPEYYSQSRWRGTLALDGGGALMNQAIHTVDLLLWLLGDVNHVQARTVTALHNIEGEDTALAILEFSSGVLGSLQATTAAYPGYPRRLELTGSEGTVILEHDRIIAANLRQPPPGATNLAPDQNQSASSAVVSDVRGHQALLEDFIHAIERNTTPVCDGRDGRRSVALIEAIYRAASTAAGSHA
jgi:UDP-N-acetyl-2-amino-2-deoxyglucuronate dehydrogenase